MIEFNYEKRGRNNKGWSQFLPFLASIQYTKNCYCDGSVSKKDPLIASFAVWSAKDFSFVKRTLPLDEIREFVFSAGIRKAKHLIDVDAVEMAALILTHQTYPGYQIFSDSKKGVKLAEKIGIHAEWIPRELNTLADYIVSHSEDGMGHIAFNSTKVDRGWIDLIIDRE